MKKTKRDAKLKNMLKPIKQNILSGEALKRYESVQIDHDKDNSMNQSTILTINNETSINNNAIDSLINNLDKNMLMQSSPNDFNTVNTKNEKQTNGFNNEDLNNSNKQAFHSSFNSSHYDSFMSKSIKELIVDLRTNDEFEHSLKNGEDIVIDIQKSLNEIKIDYNEQTNELSINLISPNNSSQSYQIEDDQSILTRSNNFTYLLNAAKSN